MVPLPSTGESVLVRIDLGSESAWRDALEVALGENDDKFRAYVKAVGG